MAIEPGLLRLRYGDASINASSLSLRWEVYHPATDTVIEAGTVSVRMAAPQRVEEAWAQAVALAQSAAAAVLDRHAPVAAIGGRSVFDADLALDGWLLDPEAHTLAHPLCGTIEGIGQTGAVALVNAVLAACLPPPTWAWARSMEPGKLSVKCVAVPGATAYRAYDGEVLVGQVPDLTDWVTVDVPVGAYSVRVGGVVNGQLGILSFPIAVEVVGAASAEAPAPVLVVEETETETPRGESRLRRFLRDPFGVLPR